jgi:hypothetical protein
MNYISRSISHITILSCKRKTGNDKKRNGQYDFHSSVKLLVDNQR